MNPAVRRPSAFRHWIYRLVENPDRDFIPGRIFTLAVMTLILGIGLFALPAGILAGGFTEHLRQKPPPKLTHCPHCGRELTTNDGHRHGQAG